MCERTLGDVERIQGGYMLHIRKSKTVAGVRSIPILHPIPVAILRGRIGKRAEKDAQLFTEFIPGGPMSQLSWHVQKALGRYRDRIGLPAEVDQHSTRRQFATQVERLGIDPLAAERYFGHKPAGLMRGLYAKGNEEAMREVAKAISYPAKIETALSSALGFRR
jgi:integrase